MEECFRCGVSDQNETLHDAISEDGVVKVCSKCARGSDFPVVKKKDLSLDIADKVAPIGGLIKEREKVFEQIKSSRRAPVPSKQDVSLRALVEKNYKQDVNLERKSWPGVVRNFNWIILRARRNVGLGQRELAEKIGEPEIAIRMAERGTLPKEYVPFLRKLEGALRIELMENHPFRLEEHKRMLNFKENSLSNLKISDLKKISVEREVETIPANKIVTKESIEKPFDSSEEASQDEEAKKESSGFFKKFFSK